jgi:ABC-type transport system substrate-binding protein
MTHSLIDRFGVRLLLLALCAAAFVPVIACGEDAAAPVATAAAPQQPATAMPAAPGDTAAPGATAAPAATARPAVIVTTSPPDAPDGGGGPVTVVRANVGVPVGLPAQCPPGCGVEKFTMGAYEMLLQATGLDYTLSGLVAENWSVTPDGSAYIWRIRPGIQFHGGWGELTAEDVAWTHNNSNAATNISTAHDNAGDLRAHIGLATAVDTYTVNMPITSPDARQPTHLFTNVVPRGVGIHSKAVYDEFGETGMLTQFIGSGPFEIEAWRQDDRLVLNAFDDYWGEKPLVDQILVLAVPEPAIRSAMFESGEANIADVEPKDRPRLVADHNGVIVNNGGSLNGIVPCCNYLERVGAATGNPLESPGYHPELPWIADIDDPACDEAQLLEPVPSGPICDSWESARLVRRALEISINRDQINQQIYAGLAVPAYGPPGQASISSLFKEEWKDEFSIDRAKELLAEAGYPNGLNETITVHAEGLSVSLTELLCATWQPLGLSCEIDQRVYAVKRPSYVDRSNESFTYAFIPRFDPEDWPIDTEDHSWKEGGTQKGGNIPFSALTFELMRSENDPPKRIELYKDWIEHYQYWAWSLPIAEVFNQTLYNSSTIEFSRNVYPTFGYAYSIINPVTQIRLK